MFYHFLTDLFEITLDLDGHLNRLHTETICLHNRIHERKKRTLYYGHWGIQLIENGKVVGRLKYPVGIQGPISHFPKIRKQAEDWRDRKNEMPD